MPSKTSERINFGKIKEVITPPNLIEVQNNSYAEFLQSEIDPKKRENLGLQAVFNEVFPIESYDGKCVLEFSHYEIGEPKLAQEPFLHPIDTIQDRFGSVIEAGCGTLNERQH